MAQFLYFILSTRITVLIFKAKKAILNIDMLTCVGKVELSSSQFPILKSWDIFELEYSVVYRTFSKRGVGTNSLQLLLLTD